MSNKIEFIFKIYEIANKHIAENYVNEVKQQLEEKSIKHSFQLITEPDNNVMYGGSDSTYPYNLFESAFDGITNRIKGVVPKTNTESYAIRKGIFDRLFSSFSTAPTNDGVDELKKLDNNQNYEGDNLNIEENYNIDKNVGYETSDDNGEPIVFPNDYTGVIIIHLKIYTDEASYQYVGGLKDYEDWIKKVLLLIK